MKTVKNNEGNVKRVEDGTAAQMVNSGKWDYCGKEEYKKLIKSKPQKTETTETDLKSRGLSDKKLRRERKRAKSNRG